MKKVVIELSDEVYASITNPDSFRDIKDIWELQMAVNNGTVLSEDSDGSDWVYDRLPTWSDIDKNSSPYFLCITRYNSYPQRVAFSTNDNKWYKTWDKTKFVDEQQVIAWMPMPKADYDFIKQNTKIGE